ncbi:MAG: isopentenyl-diphosphate delta-isomerase [Bacteroidota bacterium]
MEDRKKDHINLAFSSRILEDMLDKRFSYEPILSSHPEGIPDSFSLGRKKMKVPVWVSSMTGGTKHAANINKNLAIACREYRMGMGLGSCRIILDDDTYFEDFNVRQYIGDDQPLYANLGICQVEEMIELGKTSKIEDLVKKLNADGLIVHVNPMQEWLQPEGDRMKISPLATIKRLIDLTDLNLIVKEVGQGMGEKSLEQLLQLPLTAIEFGAFGGTNFAKLELERSSETNRSLYEPFSRVGHTAEEMVFMINKILDEMTEINCSGLIISGGIKSFIDGYYLMNISKMPSIYGQASSMLKFALKGLDELMEFIDYQVKGLEMAYAYLKVK